MIMELQWPKNNYGWTCPKCGCSYAPWVNKCFTETCKAKVEYLGKSNSKNSLNETQTLTTVKFHNA